MDQNMPLSFQRVLGNICILLMQGTLQNTPTASLLFDCATLVVRGFSAESLAILYKRLSDDVKQDPRVRSVLGVEESDARWLASATKVTLQQQTSSGSPTVTQGAFQSPARPTIGLARPALPGQQQAISMATASSQIAQALPTPSALTRAMGGAAQDTKYTPFVLRRWELMQDPTPNAGENDTSLSLQLFAARRVL